MHAGQPAWAHPALGNLIHNLMWNTGRNKTRQEAQRYVCYQRIAEEEVFAVSNYRKRVNALEGAVSEPWERDPDQTIAALPKPGTIPLAKSARYVAFRLLVFRVCEHLTRGADFDYPALKKEGGIV